MHILCTICSDLVNQAESLYVTKCGHIFHHHCLAQWIERSKSCPQCRNKVTDRCMFRLYPTVSNENSGEDAATLQSRLDDAMLQLRTQRAGQTELQDKLAAITQDLNKKDESLRAAEKRLASREAAAAALREQLEYAKLQAEQAQRLRHENEALAKSLQMLDGLQKVLNATAGEVEDTLRGYSDLRTLATFAAALKRALCESESKKRACRELQREAERRLAAQRARYDDLHANFVQAQEQLAQVERSYAALAHKRRASADADADAAPRRAKHPRPAASPPAAAAAPAPAPDLNDAIVSEHDTSFGAGDSGRANCASPYLALKQSSFALSALQQRRAQPATLKPSEFALLSSAPTSIFRRAGPLAPAPAPRRAAPDGLGGRARRSPSPAPSRPPAPRPPARPRLRRPAPPAAGCRDIAHMFASLRGD